MSKPLGLLAVALLAPSPCLAADSGLSSEVKLYEDGILKQQEPFEAALFLKDDKTQAWLKQNDPKKFNALFQSALMFKDLGDLFKIDRDPYALRQALLIRARQGSWITLKLGGLFSWVQLHERQGALRLTQKAVWEWNTLSPNLMGWLELQSIDEPQWEKLSFLERQARLAGYGDKVYQQLMSEVPKNRLDLSLLQGMANDAVGTLDKYRSNALNVRLQNAGTLIDGIEEARRKLLLAKNQEWAGRLADQLDAARNAGSLEEMAGRLSRVFDGLGLDSTQIRRAEAPRLGQRLSDKDRSAVAGLLKTGLLREISRTTAGKEELPFFKSHPLVVRIESRTSGGLASYNSPDQSIIFNENYILEYLKTSHSSVKDLEKGKALGNLVQLEAVNFAHEAKHYMQDAWRRDNKLAPLDGNQDDEIEAKETGALFFLEKANQDPQYAATLYGKRNSSVIARSNIYEAESFSRDPYDFSREIAGGCYADTPSLEERAAALMRMPRWVKSILEKELARRALLPASMRGDLEKNGWNGLSLIPGKPLTRAEWQEALVRAKTSVIVAAAKKNSQEIENIERSYALSKTRFEKADVDMITRLNELGTEDGGDSGSDEDVDEASRPILAVPPPPTPVLSAVPPPSARAPKGRGQ